MQRCKAQPEQGCPERRPGSLQQIGDMRPERELNAIGQSGHKIGAVETGQGQNLCRAAETRSTTPNALGRLWRKKQAEEQTSQKRDRGGASNASQPQTGESSAVRLPRAAPFASDSEACCAISG